MGKITTQDKWIITGLLSPFIIIFMFKFIVYPAVIIDISRNQESEQFVLPADSLEEIQDTYHKYLAYKDSFYFMRDTMFTEEVKLLPRTEREYLNLKIKKNIARKKMIYYKEKYNFLAGSYTISDLNPYGLPAYLF